MTREALKLRSYILRRIVGIIPTLLLLLLCVVALVRLLPGDAVDAMLAEQGANVSEAERDRLREGLGLDKSLPHAYVSYVADAARGDLGRSLWSGQPVTELVVKRLPVTVELLLLAIPLTALVGVGIGVVSAVARGRIVDHFLRGVSILGLSIPTFILATVLVIAPTVWWGWSPPLSYSPWSAGASDHILQYVAPACILAITLGAALMRLTRTMMLEVLNQDYIRTAKAKGLARVTYLWRHALPNALIPVVTLLGIQIAELLSGTVILETIFGLPGIGRELLHAVGVRDYPIIQGLTLVAGLLVIGVNLTVDLLYPMVDPRVRLH